MIVYKWVIKEKDYYKPIINNGAYRPANNVRLDNYKKGKTIKDFIDIHNFLNNKSSSSKGNFHKKGFHFWKYSNHCEIENYQHCIEKNKGEKINCILKCYIRNKDIILEDDNRIIAKQFRIIGEI